MTIITISRQMGSLGCQVAHLVADTLGYRLVWREVINQAAQRAGAPEMALEAIDELGLLDLHPSPKDYQAYRHALKQVMEELAEQGNVVIVGRAGQVNLANHPHTLHVRLIASTSLRAERVAQRHAISLESALAQIEASDRRRTSYMRRFYHERWDNPDLYHLVLNTGLIPPQSAAALICQAIAYI